MPNLFSSVNLALTSMLSQQYGISITEHNVANANTEGYRRQQVVLQTAPPVTINGAYTSGVGIGQLGSGVEVEKIDRITVNFYDARYRAEAQQSKNWNIQNSLLSQLESQLSETDSTGVLPKLDAFFISWQNLSVTPTDPALKNQLINDAQSLVSALNSRAIDMNAMRTDQNVEIIQRVQEINQGAEQIAQLNAEIARVTAVGAQPNDLMDQRDLLLDRLAEVGGATSNTQANGQVIVSINNHVLVAGTRSYALTTSQDDKNNDLAKISWSDGEGLIPTSGELAGFLAVRDILIPQQQTGLNNLAQAVKDRVNTLHQKGFSNGKIVTNATTTGTVSGFGAAATSGGQLEFATGSYFVETQNDPVNGWQYRVVDAGGNPPKFTDGTDDTNSWQNIPTSGSMTVDTGHGLTITFGSDATAYLERDRTNGAAQVTFTQQQDFFTGTDAMSIRVNSNLVNNPTLVATALNPNSPGDGEIARQLGNVRSEQLLSGGAATLSQYYNQQITQLALNVKKAAANEKDHQNISDALDSQRTSVSGVSLNEEAANMVKYQRAFEASARMMTTVDQMLDTIINSMGVVGR